MYMNIQSAVMGELVCLLCGCSLVRMALLEQHLVCFGLNLPFNPGESLQCVGATQMLLCEVTGTLN